MLKDLGTNKLGCKIRATCCDEDNSGHVYETPTHFVASFSYPVGEDEHGLIHDVVCDTLALAVETLRNNCGAGSQDS